MTKAKNKWKKKDIKSIFFKLCKNDLIYMEIFKHQIILTKDLFI